MTSNADANRLILTGENPFIRLSETDGGPNTTDASFWRIIFSPGRPGPRALPQERADRRSWRIYTDNIAMARWLQSTVQGMLNPETRDPAIAVVDAEFGKEGDVRDFWTERVISSQDEVSLTWHEIGEPLLLHTQPNAVPERPYGVCTVLIPALAARLTVNGEQAARPALAARARGPAVQHLRAGLLGELDRAALGLSPNGGNQSGFDVCWRPVGSRRADVGRRTQGRHRNASGRRDVAVPETSGSASRRTGESCGSRVRSVTRSVRIGQLARCDPSWRQLRCRRGNLGILQHSRGARVPSALRSASEPGSNWGQHRFGRARRAGHALRFRADSCGARVCSAFRPGSLRAGRNRSTQRCSGSVLRGNGALTIAS